MKRIMDKLDKVEDKIDRKFDVVETRLDSMDKLLVKQEANLSEHMRRTDILEKLHEENADEIAAIKKPFIVAYGIGKILGFVSLVLGIIGAVAKIFFGL